MSHVSLKQSIEFPGGAAIVQTVYVNLPEFMDKGSEEKSGSNALASTVAVEINDGALLSLVRKSAQSSELSRYSAAKVHIVRQARDSSLSGLSGMEEQAVADAGWTLDKVLFSLLCGYKLRMRVLARRLLLHISIAVPARNFRLVDNRQRRGKHARA